MYAITFEPPPLFDLSMDFLRSQKTKKSVRNVGIIYFIMKSYNERYYLQNIYKKIRSKREKSYPTKRIDTKKILFSASKTISK